MNKKKSSFSFQLFPSAEAYFNLVSLVSSRFIEIHRVVWVGKDSRDYPVPTSLSWAGTPSTRLPAPPKLAINTSRDEVSTAPLGGLLQCSITPVGNNFFQIPKLNLPFCFRLLPSVLSFHSWEEFLFSFPGLIRLPQAPSKSISCHKEIVCEHNCCFQVSNLA